MDYEQWTREEIARLRAEALKASTAADALQNALDKWLSQGRKDSPETAIHGGNGHIRPRRGRRPGYGDKNTTALEKIRAASTAGITLDELHKDFVGIFGPRYKRANLRALLWHQKEIGSIEIRDGRYVAAAKAQTV